jgi:hypothetical protein
MRKAVLVVPLVQDTNGNSNKILASCRMAGSTGLVPRKSERVLFRADLAARISSNLYPLETPLFHFNDATRKI